MAGKCPWAMCWPNRQKLRARIEGKLAKKTNVHKLTPGEPDWDIEDLFLHSFSRSFTW